MITISVKKKHIIGTYEYQNKHIDSFDFREVYRMSQLTVVFNKPDDVLEFVNTVERFPYEMDLKRGRFIVDAKSFLGIMNMGLKTKIELKVYEEHCDDLKKAIRKFAA